MIGPAVLMLAAACAPVHGDRVTVADLAKADAAFSSAPPDTQLGYAPLPGIPRIFRATELTRLASRFGVERQGTGDICVERAVETLTPERVLPSLHAALGRSNFDIDILELYRGPVPDGVITFQPPASGAALWRGYIQYGGRQRFPIWAKVNIHGRVTRLIAAKDLKAGVPIAEDSVTAEILDAAPLPARAATSLEEVLGRIPKRSIAAGSVLSLDAIEAPFDVRRGENIGVEARCGATRLRLDGMAQSDGRRGQIVNVRNPGSGKSFQARVEGKGQVLVTAGGCK